MEVIMYGPDPIDTFPVQAEWVAQVMAEVKPKFGGTLLMVSILNDDAEELDLITADGPKVAIIERALRPRFLPAIFGYYEYDYIVFSVVTSTLGNRIAHACGPYYPEVRNIVEKYSPHIRTR